MALTGVIGRFATGTYSVARRAAGTYTAGRLVAGASEASFDIVACVQPASGRELQVLPEAQHGEEVKLIFTTTELRTRTPTHDPDVITISGEAYEVFKVETWEAFDDVHYKAFAKRVPLP